MNPLKKILSWLRAPIEAMALSTLLLFAFSELFSLPWRSWISSAVLARSAPYVLSGLLVALLIVALRRYCALPAGDLVDLGPRRLPARLFAWIAVGAAPISLLSGVDRYVDAQVVDLMSPLAIAASLCIILSFVLTEELIYRYLLLGRMIQVGTPALIAVMLQAFLFLLAHGKHAMTGPHTITWYMAGGITLGTLYLVTRSILAPIALHLVVDVCVAQTNPVSYWLTHRAVETMNHDWPLVAAKVWMIACLAVWVRHAWGARRLPESPPASPWRPFAERSG